MLSCKETTRLLSEAQDRKLGVSERLQLEVHLAVCTGCRNFRQHLHWLRRASRAYLGRLRGGPPDQA